MGLEMSERVMSTRGCDAAGFAFTGMFSRSEAEAAVAALP